MFGGDNNTAIFKPQINYVVNAGATKLNNGFHVERGANFKAKAITCDANSIKSAKLSELSNVSNEGSFSTTLNSDYNKDLLLYADAEDNATEKSLHVGTNSFRIMPNPNHGIFKIEFDGRIPQRMKIYSVSGDLVTNVTTLSQIQEVNISNNPDGVFIVKLIYDNEIVVGKMIKN